MINSLMQWNHFDPYYFDKLRKLDRKEASRLIEHLRQLEEIRDFKLKAERERHLKKEEEIYNKVVSFENFKIQFHNLFQGKDENGKNITLQQRGYLFETFLKNLCIYEKLEVTDAFKIVGEQIDGSLKYDGEHYLIEAKWQDSYSASDSLYQFAQKVEGKMYGRGIFISINGFSSDSVKALITGKAIRTVLIDGADITLVVEGYVSFNELINKKIKGAQTMGRIYIDINTMKDKI